jgi:hypothetical protein
MKKAEQGWNGPIAVFGYTMLFRGISVRSSTRVPTHIIVCLSKGLSTEKVVQAVGRSTGDFKALLELNGFNAVKVLCPESDFQAVIETPMIIKKLQDNLEHGLSYAVNIALDGFVTPESRVVGYRKQHWLSKIVKRLRHALRIEEEFVERAKSIRNVTVLRKLLKDHHILDKEDAARMSREELIACLVEKKSRGDSARADILMATQDAAEKAETEAKAEKDAAQKAETEKDRESKKAPAKKNKKKTKGDAGPATGNGSV